MVNVIPPESESPLDHVGNLVADLHEIVRRVVIDNERLRRTEINLLKQMAVSGNTIEEFRSEIERLRKLVALRNSMIEELREMACPTKKQADR